MSSIGRERLRRRARLSERKVREADGLCLIEGRRLVEEAFTAGRVREVFVASDADAAQWSGRGAPVEVHVLARHELERLADVRTPQDVIAVGTLADSEGADGLFAAHDRALVLEAIQDPGNVGAIVRTARALGVGAVVATAGTADLHAPKTLRASAGALFHVAQAGGVDGREVTRLAALHGHALVIPVVRGGEDVRTVEPPKRFALVLGNEGAGSAIADVADQAVRVTIPMARGAESLNVAAACAVILGRWLSDDPSRP